MKAYDFTFTLRAYGSNPDTAFQALQDVIEDDITHIFTNYVDYEEVDTKESRVELQLMMEHAIEEVVCAQEDAEA